MSQFWEEALEDRLIKWEQNAAHSIMARDVKLQQNRLAESLVLAFAGGAFGTALACGGVRLLIALAPANIPRLDEVQVSMPVLVFSGGLSIAAAIMFGILPALRSLRVAPQAALQANSTRAANTQESHRTRGLMVAAQVACTVVLLIVTSLALRSLSRLLRQVRGFDASARAGRPVRTAI